MLFDEEDKANALQSGTTKTLEGISDINEPELDLEEEESPPAPTPTAAPKPAGRYAGKTPEELAQMLEDAQSHIGRQSAEIGEVRRLADDLVKKSLNTPVKPVDPPAAIEEHEDDFFTDPQAAVARAVSKHPAVAAAKEAAETAARERSTAAVLKNHPDMTQVTSSPEFAAWVKATPMRTRMYALADQFDAEAADELLSNFKASSSFTKPPPAENAKVDDSAAKALAAGSVGTSITGASAPATKKYRRSDIMRLMTNDPARYEAMADEILKAYAEGRVV